MLLNRLRLRSLRARLTAGLVVLVLLIAAVTGLTTALLLRTSLIESLDGQLATASERFSNALRDGDERAGSGEVLQALARGQSTGTLAVLVSDGRVMQSAEVLVDGSVAPARLTARDTDLLASLRPGQGARTLQLLRDGSYRVLAVNTPQGTQITALPMNPVRDVITQLVSVEAVVGILAAVLGSIASTLLVRRSLDPLEDVTAAALHVSQLPLAGTSEGLPGPIARAAAPTEVGRVAEAVDRMVGHVRSALESRDREEARRRQFVADASHELRTPLAVVQAHTESALMDPDALPERARHAVERIQVASDRMSSLVDDLLLLARLDAGRGLARQPVALSQLVLEAVADARATDGDRIWLAELPEEPVDVTGDQDRLYQVISGLLGNASRHTPPGTTVTTTIGVVQERAPLVVQLRVADDGPGVPGELQATVFDRFTRADAARTTSAGGTGLGLAIARSIVEANGGRLDLEEAARGAAFLVQLPAADTPTNTPGRTP